MISDLSSLVVAAILAFAAPLICERLKIPIVVGEIIFGLAVGLIAFAALEFYDISILESSASLEFLALIGFIFLMFLAGLEIDFEILQEQGIKSLIYAIMIFGFTLAISYFIVSALSISEDPFFMSLVLSTTSVGVVLPTLRETGLSKTKAGQTIILSAIVADFATMILLTYYAIGMTIDVTGPGAMMPLIFIFFIVSLFFTIHLAGRLAIWHFPNTLVKFFSQDDATEMGVRASIAILFIFVAMSQTIGGEASTSIAILGAFMAGAVISFTFTKQAILEKKLFGLGFGFLIPFFFIHLGISFDFQSILEGTDLLGLMLVFLAIAFAVKLIPSLFLLPTFKARNTLAIGFLLASRLSLIIAAAEIGRELDIIDESMRSALILVGITTSIVCPMIFRRIYKPGVEEAIS